ncbi:unnamed protein product [Bursaphelenchus xylophilus]|uniref:(pine wood nematode) hypothetical protein n=1 Tax=Bursaphelenchus xylophilus TaxID=6326 RepID=A0A1I7SUB0_BURXY|nr:unnamed protein product [Bursaphelenchus xylophilus]CAG9107352.1 unnamed protein product [Bursaphelenchus xylophilus]
MIPLFRLFNPLRSQLQRFSTSPQLLKGHSKWQNIKEVKGKNDAMRSAKISFYLGKFRTACKNGGFDPKFNKDLEKLHLEYKAKSLPADTLNRFLTRLKETPDVTCFFDLIGPSGAFIIVEAETDSSNRTKGAVQRAIKKVGGGFRFSDSNLRTRFDEKGFVVVEPKKSDGSQITLDEMEEIGIELDCEEVVELEKRDDGIAVELTVETRNLNKVEQALTDRGYVVENSQVRLIPQHAIPVSPEEMALIDKLYEQLGELEDVTQIHDNIEVNEEEQKSASAL